MGLYKLTYKQSMFVRAASKREAESKCYDMFEDGPSSVYATATELHEGDPGYDAAVNELGEEEEMKVKVKGPKNPDLKPDTHEYFHTVPLCDRQFCMTYWRDERIHRPIAQLTPRCPACSEPYMIEVDGSNVKDVTPGQISTCKCGKCGREFKYILFRSYYEENTDDPVFNGFTIKEEIE